MNQYHQKLLEEIKKYSKPNSRHGSANYVGTKSFQYHLTNPDKWTLAKKWSKENKNLSFEKFLETLSSLNSGESHDEKTMVGMILFLFPQYRKNINPKILSGWLKKRHGWSEVDNLCQNNFQYRDFFLNLSTWKKALRNFPKDKNVHIRRASLVLLTGPINYSPDILLSDLAFENIDRLKLEKDILITKSISWLLRSLIKFHRSAVEKYLEKNKTTLPKIAMREVSNKLKSGRKSGHKGR